MFHSLWRKQTQDSSSSFLCFTFLYLFLFSLFTSVKDCPLFTIFEKSHSQSTESNRCLTGRPNWLSEWEKNARESCCTCTATTFVIDSNFHYFPLPAWPGHYNGEAVWCWSLKGHRASPSRRSKTETSPRSVLRVTLRGRGFRSLGPDYRRLKDVHARIHQCRAPRGR